MNILIVGVVILTVLMYIEGLLVSAVAVGVGSLIRSKWIKILALMVWPLAMPYLIYKLYRTYAGLITQLKDNPFLSAMVNSSSAPNFLTDYASPILSVENSAEFSASNEVHEMLTADDFDPNVETNTKETQGN